MSLRKTLLVLLAILLGGAIGLSWYWDRQQESAVTAPVITGTLAIKRIRIISGHEFDITLENGKRMKGQLEIVTPTGTGSEVTKKVTDLINSAINPKVVLLNGRSSPATNDKVDILLTVKGKEISLSKWLQDNKMVWEFKQKLF